MINKIVSIASFVLAIISGILSFGFLAFSGFSPGLQMYEATPIFSFLIGAIIFILGGIFIWKGKTWAKILVGLGGF
jgi:hypothetical protein